MRKSGLAVLLISSLCVLASCKGSSATASSAGTDATGSDDTSSATDGGTKKKKSASSDSGTSSTADSGEPSNCPTFDAPTKVATWAAASIPESSGLVASKKNAGVLWTHNDSGNAATLFAVSAKDAHLIATYTITGASNIDWEDIALDATTGDVVVADIGDNNAVRNNLGFYRIPEPTVSESAKGLTGSIAGTRTAIAYPDGAHNAESFVIDAAHNEAYVFTKGDKSILYKIDLASTDNPVTMTKLSERVFNKEVLGKLATAADLGESGLLIRTYSQVYFFPRESGDTVEEMFKRTPCLLASASVANEDQAESIAWAADESGFYTNSEHVNTALDFTKKK